jgi:hypothetical protein
MVAYRLVAGKYSYVTYRHKYQVNLADHRFADCIVAAENIYRGRSGKQM